ncbi:MAG: magnesium-translocating P-type ATPase [Stigonema ocellatum SAG 48.90 = DSM 106950]|nr:magnesium-translocating P-type ATPase [Stigonema ocellatum SAG 48.90 = DSM 106950]
MDFLFPHRLLFVLNQKSSAKPRTSTRMSSLRVVEEAFKHTSQVLEALSTSPIGLSYQEARDRLEKWGLNEVAHERPPQWYIQLLLAFKNPFIFLLLGLAILSYFTDNKESTVIIGIMVLVSVLIRFITEFRSHQAAEALNKIVSTTATVSRCLYNKLEQKEEIPFKFLVPGDIIYLVAGDLVPADVRLLTAKDFFINQSVLTGESLPTEKSNKLSEFVQKVASPITKHLISPLELPNVCFMGTNVVSGKAKAVVVATGNKTYFGSLAKKVVGQHSQTSFDKGLNGVSWLLLRFIAVMVPIVLLMNGFTKGNWVEGFFFGVSVAVSLTPEMLPMIVTATLAFGAVKMSRHQVIVKRLNAMQNFGAMNILCTDKTGTLTQDQIILDRYLDVHGRESSAVLKYAYLNSFYQSGLKSLIDNAVLKHVEMRQDILEIENNYHKVNEIPFDFVRRRLSVVVETKNRCHLLICKGAIEEILQICTHVEVDNGNLLPLEQSLKEQVTRMTRQLNEDGLRVIAIAYKEVSPRKSHYTLRDENQMILSGYLAFLDPPKQTATEAIAALSECGVQVKILTGDNEVVTRKLCKEVGLYVHHTVLGSEIETLSDQQLAELAGTTTVFAKLSPQQKAKVIKALQSKGNTVGYLGDGINDAPALRQADVGISVDTAVDIAKESADIILLEKSLLVLEQGVIQGRRTFNNIIKYIKIVASSNFGNAFSVLGASILLPFLPMLPIHLLVQNLLYDLSQIAVPFDNVDEVYLKKPRKWMIGDIGRFILLIGPISSVFDYTTFALMWFIFGATTVESQSLFQSGWFIEGLLSQTLIFHIIRTPKIPFFQSWASVPITLLSVIIMAMGIYIPQSPLGANLGLVPLPISYFPWLILTLLSYCSLTQLLKVWYVRKFKVWL